MALFFNGKTNTALKFSPMLFLVKKTDALIVLLDDLVKINNDRITCYQSLENKISKPDADLKELFTAIVNESIAFKQQLIEKINLRFKRYQINTMVSGMVHTAWVALKIKYTGNDRKAILSFCEYNEELVQQAYKTAITISSASMQKEIHPLLLQHHNSLKKTFDLIKRKLTAQPGVISYFTHAN